MIDIPIEIIVLGFIAQFFFSARVIIQWFYTERESKVITPTIYWILYLHKKFTNTGKMDKF